MSLFFRGEKRGQVTAWGDDGWSGAGSGMAPEKAIRLTPYFASLRHLFNYTASLPVDTFWHNLDGTRALSPEPELFRDLNSATGPGVGAWFGQAAYAIGTYGNAVGWVAQVNGFGHPTRIFWLEPHDWSYDEISHQWHVFGRPVPTSRIFHVPWIVPPGKTIGLSPMQNFIETFSAGLSAQEYADIKRGGGLPPSTLKNEGQVVDADQAARIERRLVQKFMAGRPFVHGKDWTFTPTAVPPNHTQFIETLKLTANQIAAIFGFDPTEVGGEAANSQQYANEEHREIRRAADMRPYLVALENAVSRILGNRTFVRFNIDSTIRVDLKSRVEVQEIEVRMGKKSVNEIRATDDLPPVSGGDYHNVPAPKAAPTERNPS